MAVYAYLRVSTKDQELDKFKDNIEKYCVYKDLGNPIYVEEKISGRKVSLENRKLNELLHRRDVSDIVSPELTRLGRNTSENLDILQYAKNRGITIHLVKEDIIYDANPSPHTKMFVNMLSVLAEYEADLISIRIKEKLDYLKAHGKKLGRQKGTMVRTHFDDYNEDLMEYYEDLMEYHGKDVLKNREIEELVENYPNICNYLDENNITAVNIKKAILQLSRSMNIERICELSVKGWLNEEIAKEFGVSERYFYKFLNVNNIKLQKELYLQNRGRKPVKKVKKSTLLPKNSDVLRVSVI